MRNSSRFIHIAVVITLAAVVTIQPGSAQAQDQWPINFQGILLDTAGDPVTGPTSVLFEIWDAPVAGTSQWSETQIVTPDSDGRFNVLLGSVNPIPDAALAGGSAYVSTKVDTDPEMSPRAQLVSVGYAHRTKTVDGASGGTVSGELTVDAAPGDAAMSLPDDAISPVEIFAEPGIAANFISPTLTLANNATEMVDLVTVEITTPTDGYIVVHARAGFRPEGTTGANRAYFQIDETMAGGFNGTQIVVGLPAYPTSVGSTGLPVYMDRIYSKTAGTYTFRLEAMVLINQAAAANAGVQSRFISATFHPTTYGTVTVP